MGFFKKSLPSESKRTALTIIAKGNKISGEMSITGKLHIDGCVEGRITSVENVSIGRTGEVKGRIEAKNVTVSGLIEGEVFCDHLHLSSGGRVVATVECCELTMDAKSQFIGERQPLKLPDLQKAIALKDQVNQTAIEETVQQSEKSAQRAVQKIVETQSFIDDLPDKVTLAPTDNADLESIEAEISFLDKKAENVESIENTAEILVVEKTPVVKEQPKRTGSEKRIDKRIDRRREIEQSTERRKSSRRIATEGQQQSEEKNIKDKSIKKVEQPGRVKVTDKNTTKLELKF